MKISLSQINPYNFSFRKNAFSKPSELEKTPERDSFELSIGYVNDIHGQTNNMMRILSGLKGDLRLAGGDIAIGDEKNKAVNMTAVTFMNLAKIEASALGNHEMDTTQGDLADTIKEFKGNILASNLNKVPVKNQSENDVKEFNRVDLINHLQKSVIKEVNGEKIGIIGAAPVDLAERITHPNYHKDCQVGDLDETIENVQAEIDSLAKQGINKIVLVSHLGYEADKVLAAQTSGVDVIIGGHTHELVKDIKENENLIYSKTGDPVIITEAGKNGNYFGRLDLTFDKDGLITKAQNNLGETKLFHKNMINNYIFNQILGEPEVVGYIKSAPEPPKTLIEENPHANFMCDAMKNELNVDIALWNNSGTRSYFQAGIIDSRDIKDIAPFEDRVSVADVSEKKLVEMFKNTIETTYKSAGNKPGLLAVSGLTYTVDTKEGKLKAMSFVDNNGQEHPIDIDNPREDRLYKLAQDSFMMFSGADLIPLASEEECVNYPFNKDFVACEYIKHIGKPIEINQVGRIKFE